MRRFPCLYGKKQRMGLDYMVRQLSKYDIVYIVQNLLQLSTIHTVPNYPNYPHLI